MCPPLFAIGFAVRPLTSPRPCAILGVVVGWVSNVYLLFAACYATEGPESLTHLRPFGVLFLLSHTKHLVSILLGLAKHMLAVGVDLGLGLPNG